MEVLNMVSSSASCAFFSYSGARRIGKRGRTRRLRRVEHELRGRRRRMVRKKAGAERSTEFRSFKKRDGSYKYQTLEDT